MGFIDKLQFAGRQIASIDAKLDHQTRLLRDHETHLTELLESKIDVLERRIQFVVDELERTRMASNHAVRSSHRSPGRLRVVFLVHHVGAWASVEGIIRRLLLDERFKVTVTSIPKHFPGDDRFEGETEVHEFLSAQGIKHLRFALTDPYAGTDLLRALEPDVVFRQSQWDADVQAAYSVANLGFTRLALVSYEILNFIEAIPELQDTKDPTTDYPLHRFAWRVFVPSQTVADEAHEKNVLGGENFVVTGHPKIQILRSIREQRQSGMSDFTMPKVMFSFHHSIGNGWTKFGIFPRVWRDILATVEELREINFVLSMHPALDTILHGRLDGGITADEVNEFDQRWAALPNTTRIEPGAYLNEFAKLSAIVTDGISMFSEGQIAGVPVIWLERKEHVRFGTIGEQIAHSMYKVATVSEAMQTVTEILRGKDSLAEHRDAMVESLFPDVDAVGNIVRELVMLGERVGAIPATRAKQM